MAGVPRSEPQTHVLLIGIDNYLKQPLSGCVNDIDAVQRVLLGPRMRIPPEQITRLVSPAPSARANDGPVADRPATLAEIRAALDWLGSDAVAYGDRVFIYYAGHGARSEFKAPNGSQFHRESLVPVDYEEDGAPAHLLYDHELNRRLRAIAARTPATTVVLDCCHSAGVGRTKDPRDLRQRCLDFEELYPGIWPLPAEAADRAADETADEAADETGQLRAAPGLVTRGGQIHTASPLSEACHIVAGCLNHEQSYESTEGGTRHGRMTRAFLTALDASCAPDLKQLTWARIWHPMLHELKRLGGGQHPWMSGPPARAVFGGESTAGDSGLPVTDIPLDFDSGGQRNEPSGYWIAAGELADVTPGAELAVYGEEPEELPPLGSPADIRARIGRIRVTRADRVTATAIVQGPPFALPPGARGRVIKLGEMPPLRYEIVPPTPELGRLLLGSPLLARAVPRTALEVPPAVPEASPAAHKIPHASPDIVLRRHGDRWYLTDAIHGLPGTGPTLFALAPYELDAARAVLEHYAAYARPLRMAARCGDLPGCLELSVLRVDGIVAPADAQAGGLPEADLESPGWYRVVAGESVCFRVRNRSEHLLRVTLANAAASGKVQLLGDQIIDPDTHYVFWANGDLGAPFQMTPPDGLTCCADQLVAIGRTALDHDLEHLRLQHGFADVVKRYRDDGSGRDFEPRSPPPAPLSHWTATSAVVVTSR